MFMTLASQAKDDGSIPFDRSTSPPIVPGPEWTSGNSP